MYVYMYVCMYVYNRYETSALVSDIMYKFKIPVTLAQPSNFVCGKTEIVHPHYVLEEHVTLYCISQGENIFVR